MKLIILIIAFSFIFYSIALCQSWDYCTKPKDDYISWLEVNNDYLYLKFSWNDTLYRSTDNGDSWTKLSIANFPHFSIDAIAFNNQNEIFIGIGTYIFKSDDFGQNWNPCSQITGSSFISGLAFNSIDQLFAVTRSDSIYYSNDNGQSWIKLDGSYFYSFSTIEINDSDHIFIGTEDSAFRSINNGKTWVEINSGFKIDSSGLMHPLGISQFIPIGEGKILVNTYGGGGLYYSSNNGDYWKRVIIENDSSIKPIGQVLAYHDYPIISLGSELYTSFNGGKTWENIEYLSSDIPLHLLAINTEGKIFAYDYINNNLLKSNHDFLSIRKHQTNDLSINLKQNYPNPFNSTTTIEYDISQSVNVKIVIYDILGNTVMELENSYKAPGHYIKKWDGKNMYGDLVSTGVYYYQFLTNGYSVIKKMLLIK